MSWRLRSWSMTVFFLSLLLSAYFFVRHNQYCEPYSILDLCACIKHRMLECMHLGFKMEFEMCLVMLINSRIPYLPLQCIASMESANIW